MGKSRVKTVFERNFSYFHAMLLLLMIFPLQAGATVSINATPWDWGFGSKYFNYMRAEVIVTDASGNFVTGLSRSDFQLTETLLASTGEVLETKPASFAADAYYQFGMAEGFWERTVAAEKLDLVIFMDGTGTMGDDVDAIHQQILAMLDDFDAAHLDYRLSVGTIGAQPGGLAPMLFKTGEERQEIEDWLDKHFHTGGESWDPVAAHDAVMFAAQMHWREDANVKKAVVVITDFLPITIYGSFWYAGGTTAATVSAARIALENSGIKVLYSQPEKIDHPSADVYSDPKINPKAANDKAGFEALGLAPLNGWLGTEAVGWPFDREKLYTAVYGAGGLPADSPIVESAYYFAWEGQVQPTDHIYADPPLGDNPQIKTTVLIADPDNPAIPITAEDTDPMVKDRLEIMLDGTDEEGVFSPYPHVALYVEMGGRFVEMRSSEAYESGQDYMVIDHLPPVEFLFDASDLSGRSYWDEHLRYQTTGRLTLANDASFSLYLHELDQTLQAQAGETMTFPIMTADKRIEIPLALGLVKDLGAWGVTDKPFREFKDDAEVWLAEIQTSNGGLSWSEMIAVKRFYTALSGYANATAYAEIEAARGVEDFVHIIKNVRDIVKRARDVENESNEIITQVLSWTKAIFDTFKGKYQSIPEKAAIEEALNQLRKYVQEEMIPELTQLILSKIAESETKDRWINLFQTIMDEKSWDDSAVILQAVTEALLEEALDQASRELTNALIDNLRVQIFDDSPEAELVFAALKRYKSKGFDGVKKLLLEYDYAKLGGGKEQSMQKIDNFFVELEDNMTSGPARDFLLPMIHLFIRSAVMEGQIDEEVVFQTVAHFFVNELLVAPYVGGPFNSMMTDALDRAKRYVQRYVPGGEDRDVWESDMHSDFWEFRGDIMGPLNTSSWDALGEQSPFNERTMMGNIFDTVLPMMSNLLYAMCAEGDANACNVQPKLEALLQVVDTVEILTTSMELGMKAADMAQLRTAMKPANDVLFPEVFSVDPIVYDFGMATVASAPDALIVTISNYAAAAVSLSSINFSGGSSFLLDIDGGPNPCASTSPTINVDESCTIAVRFEPETVGVLRDVLVISSPELSAAVRLSGYASSEGTVDSDGIPDDEECGPDGTLVQYDGDGNGVPDSLESAVASFHTADRQHYVTLVSSGGTAISDITAASNPSEADAPTFVEFEYGFFEFNVQATQAGTAKIELLLPAGSNVNTYYKYGPTTDNPQPHWYEFMYDGQTGAVIEGDKVTLYFADGERGDDDLAANGTIADRGAPGLKADLPPSNGDGDPPDAEETSSGGGGGGGCFFRALVDG